MIDLALAESIHFRTPRGDGMDGPNQRTTSLLTLCSKDSAGHPDAFAELVGIVYADLRRLASSFLGRERANHTLSATDLVHDAYERLVDQSQVDWKGRAHFLAIAARSMRRILIDHARKHARAKRGGDWQRVTFHSDEVAPVADSGLDLEDLLALDSALEKLTELDEREARIVELRFFGGSSIPEIAETLGMSTRSVERDWAHAKSWLRRELSTNESS